MTYGTNAAGKQTASFIYDVWDSSAPQINQGHLTLPNTTNTDIFCSAQTVLPGTGELFIAGGDNYVNNATTNTGNNNSNLFNPGSNTLSRGNNMSRVRGTRRSPPCRTAAPSSRAAPAEPIFRRCAVPMAASGC